ncbi:transposase, IS116/IS110/IS902 family [Leptospira noguchii str. 2001034031]|uniref:Transposase, IS116/IS110/IS902 family n=1 Tax=Leptospira noguchii str. 2001034031 TaxID=1193053 RepID=M6XXU1_9LEPT|nr:transposase, IS116/IS110/IS902 family [Leptospira noguchii str. 2001034031]
MITSLAIMSYMGRFSSAKQAAYYVGLVPRVDISGDSAYYGRIVNRGCHSIRRVIVQAAWSLVRCQHGGKIKDSIKDYILKNQSSRLSKNDRGFVFYDSNRNSFRFYA